MRWAQNGSWDAKRNPQNGDGAGASRGTAEHCDRQLRISPDCNLSLDEGCCGACQRIACAEVEQGHRESEEVE